MIRYNFVNIVMAVLIAIASMFAVASIGGCASKRVFVKDCVKGDNVELWNCELL